MAVGCGKPVRTTCAVCRTLINNAAWTCRECSAPNPLRLVAERRRQQLAHVDLWSCIHCRSSNDVSIRTCASCMRPRPKFPTAPAAGDAKVDEPVVAAKGEDRKEHTCVICMDKEVSFVMVPCGHFCVCGDCAKCLKTKEVKVCPVCRHKIKIVQRVYYP